jgi:myosin heavy subunit
MDAEMRAIEVDNERLAQEVRTEEVAVAMLAQDQALLEAAREQEALALRAMNMNKMKIDALKQAAQAEQAALEADARAVVVARQRIKASQEAERLVELIAQEEAALKVAELKNEESRARVESMRSAREEAERLADTEAAARIEHERELAETSAQRAEAERLARAVADENARLQAELQIMAEAYAEHDARKNAGLRDEMQQLTAALETEHLLARVRRTNWIARLSQGALVATLLLSAGLWMNTPNTVAYASGQISTKAAAPVVAEARMDLASFQLATELSMPTLKVAAAE